DWQQSKLYYKEDNQGSEKLVLDPNQFSEDGTVALSGVSVSSDAKLLAYAISDGGSDWKTWKIRNLESGLDLEDKILWSKFSGAEWLKDNSGFYYSAYSEPQAGAELQDINTNQKLYLHKIGEKQSSDLLIYARPDEPDWGWGPTVSEDGNYLILHVSQGTDERNRIFYQNLNHSSDSFIELIPELKAQFHFVGNEGSVFWFFTDLNAPMGRLIAIDISNPKEENWEEIIPERNHALREVHITSGYFLCHYLKDISSEVVLYQTTGERIEKLDFPMNGTISSISTKPESSQLFFSFSNYIRPSEIFEYDLSVKQLKSIWSQSVPGFNADEFTSKQAFYKSKDGTLIPMFISHLNGIELNNDNPLLLYGYGGFDIPILPNFSTKYFSWMKMGGIVAVANLRGGGEYGEKWHRQGMLHNKQNVFDDFAAAAEYLHQEGYSQPSKTVIEGRSNGGLLVGASLLQRPELFGATLPGVGVMDMLRFNKFTIGWAWESDYGSPEIEDDFKVLIKYSPYHNIKAKKCYPPTLITTSERD
ncbi:MAG: prolyl oligopeptidase family serine peptidase, partial [Gammaproteobacteria bacterium]